jgi:thiopurine S-methyltransferase
MEHEFWHERWEKDEIGFHQVTVNEELKRFLGRLELPAGAHVMVPFCGKTLDMWWLRERGFRVTGVELSPVAVKDFFDDAGLTPVVRRQDGFEVCSAAGVELICGDFFKLEPGDFEEVNAVYDRAALVALPPAMRPAYVGQMTRLTPPGVQTLLISLDYPQHEMRGPPFAVSSAEIAELFGAQHEIEALHSEDRLEQEPRFRARGLTRLLEQVYRLERRGDPH